MLSLSAVVVVVLDHQLYVSAAYYINTSHANACQLNNTTHLPKYTIADIKEKLIAPDQLGVEYYGDNAEYISVSSSSNAPGGGGGGKKFAVVEFDESMTLLWRKLRAA